MVNSDVVPSNIVISGYRYFIYTLLYSQEQPSIGHKAHLECVTIEYNQREFDDG